MCDAVEVSRTVIKYAIPIVGWLLLYYLVVVKPRRESKEELMLAEYNELMRKSGFRRSRIGKVQIWIPVDGYDSKDSHGTR